MKLSRLILFALLISVGVSLTGAQESIRLQFEIVKDGSIVAKPEVSVISGSTGSIEIDNVGRFAFTPTFRGSDGVAIAFDISSGGKQFQPRLVIDKNKPGSLSWTSETRAESFKLNAGFHETAGATMSRRG
jgi:hypothetical protein